MPGINHLAVLQALRTRLVTVSGLPAARSWENVAFTPPNPPAPHIRETFMPATDRLIATNQRGASGVVQYSLFYLVGASVEAIFAMADAVALAFNQNRNLTASIWVTHAERGPGIPEKVYYQVPIFVNWLAFGTNE